MANLMILYHLIAAPCVLILFIVVFFHFMSYCKRKKPVKLDKDSYVVLIGGCMGIGKIMALQLVQKYHSKILIADVRKDLFESVSAELSLHTTSCHFYYVDLSDKESVNKFINYLLDQKKQITMLIYNAGIVYPKKSWEHSMEDIERVMRVNYFSAVEISLKLMKYLEGGHFCVVASLVSIIPGGLNVSSYGGSKHAIFGYMNTFRQELQKYGVPITVSIACPYAINTTMFQGFKTKIQWFFPVLDQNYVAKRLLKQFIEKRQIIYVYQYQALFFKLAMLLPSYINDKLSNALDISNFHSLLKRQQKEKALKQQRQRQQ